MNKYTVNYKNQIIKMYGYDDNTKDYYAVVNNDIISAKNLKELCNKIGISHTALHRDVQRNDIVKF